MDYFKIKRRMVELDAILKKSQRDKKNWYIKLVRRQLANLIKRNRLAWIEVQ
tara:strand:+ start:355 stop:510 length:156 start_codon:yes stop_codon:yes gene_type:complete